MSGEATSDDVSTTKIADSTDGFSGSDLRQLCTAAAMCGIRELMKATSKATQDKAAANKARHTAKLALPGITKDSDKADSESGGAQQQQNQQSGMTMDTADQSSNGQVNGPTVLSASSASPGDDKAHRNPSKGNKRDNEEGGGSMTTKRLKNSGGGSAETSLHAPDIAADSAQAAATVSHKDSSNVDAEANGQSETLGTVSSQVQLQVPAAEADRQDETRGQMVEQQQSQPEASRQDRSQTVDWLLARYNDVAAAADQQVSPNLLYGIGEG